MPDIFYARSGVRVLRAFVINVLLDRHSRHYVLGQAAEGVVVAGACGRCCAVALVCLAYGHTQRLYQRRFLRFVAYVEEEA